MQLPSKGIDPTLKIELVRPCAVRRSAPTERQGSRRFLGLGSDISGLPFCHFSAIALHQPQNAIPFSFRCRRTTPRAIGTILSPTAAIVLVLARVRSNFALLLCLGRKGNANVGVHHDRCYCIALRAVMTGVVQQGCEPVDARRYNSRKL